MTCKKKYIKKLKTNTLVKKKVIKIWIGNKINIKMKKILLYNLKI